MTLFHAFLDQIVVVMVNTTLPANIGSAARAMHTMGLSHLTVVEPKLPINDDAMAYAAGATAVLKNAKIVSSLEEAVADCHWVLAASSRKRSMPQLVITPRQASQMMLEQFLHQSKSSDNNDKPFKIALVFGREDRGLTNDELSLADYHIQIPANPTYGVLNVAAAIQVIASVFFETAIENLGDISEFSDLADFVPNLTKITSPVLSDKKIDYIIRQSWDEAPISHEQKQRLQLHLLALLEQVELFNPHEPKLLPHRLTRLANRLQLDVKEYELLQATIAKIQKKLDNTH